MASLFPFRWRPVWWFVDPTYRSAFYAKIDREYCGFYALTCAETTRDAIAPRVAAAIRVVAAFSAWYPVLSVVLDVSFFAAEVVAYGIAGALATSFALENHDVAYALLCVTLSILAVTSLKRVLVNAPRTWPFDTIVLSAVAAVLFALAQSLSSPSWVETIREAASIISACAWFCLLSLLAIVYAQAMNQFVTWRKISKFPEFEIIQTISYLLVLLHSSENGFRRRVNRARVAELLEWIARRLDRDFVRVFSQGHSSVTAMLNDEAAKRAEAFRLRERAAAFPDLRTYAALSAFLWDALEKACTNRWGDLESAAPIPPPGRAAKTAEIVRSALSVALPLVGAFVVMQPGIPVPDTIRPNVALTLASWSLVGLLALLNPRQFEKQLDATKTLSALMRGERESG